MACEGPVHDNVIGDVPGNQEDVLEPHTTSARQIAGHLGMMGGELASAMMYFLNRRASSVV